MTPTPPRTWAYLAMSWLLSAFMLWFAFGREPSVESLRPANKDGPAPAFQDFY